MKWLLNTFDKHTTWLIHPQSGADFSEMTMLRSATDEDINALITWIEDKNACRLWAGPHVRYPLSLKDLKMDIDFSEDNAFSMINEKGKLLGFGQLIEKENRRLHLARLIISPVQRGQGLGSLLCRLLIAEGRNRFGSVNFSLNVYLDNRKAVRMYEKLGFERIIDPTDTSVQQASIYMILKPGDTTTF